MADTSPFSALRQYLAEKEAHLAANPLERFAAEVCESYDPDACAHDEGYCVSSGDVYGNAWKELRALRESHDALRAYVEKRGHQLSCPKVQSVHHACARCPHTCNCGYEAALAKAEALHG